MKRSWIGEIQGTNKGKAVESKRIRRAVLAVVTMGALALTTAPADAAKPAANRPEQTKAEQHCFATVVSSSHGILEIGPETCFKTEKEVDAAIRDGDSTTRGGGSMRSSSQTIGRHYKGTGYSGSSITIVGNGCNGVSWKPSGSWNNNIESSKNYCGGSGTRFYNSSSCSGSGKTIYGNKTTLGWMNNKASCVRYG